LRLESQVAEASPRDIVCDRVRLSQILTNLVHNAIKFTDRGSVRLSAAAHAEGIEFRVADTGPGIDSEDQQRIFEKFTQVDGSHQRTHDGAGLGLAIVRELAGLMGGRVSVDSHPGAGATFSFVLPVQEVAA
jgi:two-component system sensor histidine kinase BarA